jgi:hypothetical protein
VDPLSCLEGNWDLHLAGLSFLDAKDYFAKKEILALFDDPFYFKFNFFFKTKTFKNNFYIYMTLKYFSNKKYFLTNINKESQKLSRIRHLTNKSSLFQNYKPNDKQIRF